MNKYHHYNSNNNNNNNTLYLYSAFHSTQIIYYILSVLSDDTLKFGNIHVSVDIWVLFQIVFSLKLVKMTEMVICNTLFKAFHTDLFEKNVNTYTYRHVIMRHRSVSEHRVRRTDSLMCEMQNTLTTQEPAGFDQFHTKNIL